MKCNNCGNEFMEGLFCPECGTKYTSEEILSNVEKTELENQNVIEKKPELESQNVVEKKTEEVWKNKWISLLLCIFLGPWGIHRFYEKKIISGVIYFLTGGLFLVGWLIDIVRIAIKPNPYKVR